MAGDTAIRRRLGVISSGYNRTTCTFLRGTRTVVCRVRFPPEAQATGGRGKGGFSVGVFWLPVMRGIFQKLSAASLPPPPSPLLPKSSLSLVHARS